MKTREPVKWVKVDESMLDVDSDDDNGPVEYFVPVDYPKKSTFW